MYMELSEKLRILSGAAKYDVSCSSSVQTEVERKEALVLHLLVEYVIALHLMVDVFRY